MANDDLKNRAKIQKLIDENTVRAGGDFHADELCENNFKNDLKRLFKLTPKEDCNSDELLDSIIKSSTKKVIGRFNAKEFRQGAFLKELFNKFDIEKI